MRDLRDGASGAGRARASTSARTGGSRTCGPRPRRSTPVDARPTRTSTTISTGARAAADARQPPTRATSTRRRSTTRSPPRCCATATSPTRRRPTAQHAGGQPHLGAGAHRARRCIEGIRAGQSLGALLGYQFERGLHDRHGAGRGRQVHLQAAQGVPAARRPARSRRKTAEGVPIEAIEARNVVDGLALVEHMQARPGNATYPFGTADLPAADPAAGGRDRRRGRPAARHRTTRSPTWRWPRASTRRCSATTTGSPRRTTPTRAAASRPSPTSSGRRAAASASPTASRCTSTPAPTRPPRRSPASPMTPRAQAEPALNAWLAGDAAAARRTSACVGDVPSTRRPARSTTREVTLARPRAAAGRPGRGWSATTATRR